MVSKNSYMRKFVILQGRKTPYSDSKKTKGHVKVEVRDGKGKIAFNVEGLKHIDDVDKIYRGYLVGKVQSKVIKAEIGMLDINRDGQGKGEWNVDPQSIGNSGLLLSQIQAIIVTLSSYEEDSQEVIVPLVGFIEEKASYIEETIKDMQVTGQEVEIKEESYEEKTESQTNGNELMEEHQVENPIDDDIEKEHVETEDIEEDIAPIESIKETEDIEEDIMPIESIKEIEEVQEGIDPQGVSKPEIQEDDYQEDLKEYQEIQVSKEDLEVEPQEILEVDEEDEQEQEKIEVDHQQKHQEQETIRKDQYIKIDGKHEDYFVDEEDTVQGDEQEQEKVDWFNSEFQNPYGYSINKDINNENRNQIYNYQITNYTLNILKFFEKVEPLKNDLKEYEFWEIEYDENNLYRGFLPYYDYVVSMYYPYPSMHRTTTCQSLIKKYKHYIFGIVMENEEPKYYIYGIPGKFKSSEHPYRGSTGFTTWLQGKNYKDDKLGYWLLHIDTATGKVVSPLKTTRPR